MNKIIFTSLIASLGCGQDEITKIERLDEAIVDGVVMPITDEDKTMWRLIPTLPYVFLKDTGRYVIFGDRS